MPVNKLIQAGGIDLFSQAFGTPDDPALILMMGATASMDWWPDDFCQGLADRGRFVIRYDQRDTGQSHISKGEVADYDVADLALDLIHIMDGWGFARAHLVGMSLGAYVAQWVALDHPDRVASLTLIAAEPLGGEPMPPLSLDPVFLEHFGQMADLDWTDGPAVYAFLDGIARLSASPHRGYDTKGVRTRIEREMARATDLSAAFKHASLSGDLKGHDLRQITTPCLVIHGAHDPVISPDHGRAIARQIKGSKLHILPDAGHELHGDDLGTLIDLITAHTV